MHMHMHMHMHIGVSALLSTWRTLVAARARKAALSCARTWGSL